MKPRILLIVLALVVMPTAILSLIASRAFKVQGLLLQQRMETAAATAIDSVSARTYSAFDGDLDRVCMAMSDCLTRGGRYSDIASAAARLPNSKGLIKQVYLFMNPWGFVYPEELESKGQGGKREGQEKVKGKEEGSEPSPLGDFDDLVAALRRRIAATGAKSEPLRFTINNAAYCFAPLRNNKGLYAGYEIDREKFLSQLSDMIMTASREGLVLVAEGPGFTVAAPKHLGEGDVIVSDSLGEISGESVPALELARQESARSPKESVDPLIIRRLPSPFEYVRITAFLKEPEAGKQATDVPARLYGWGICLLACGIIVGTWVVIREAAFEVRLARSRSDFVMGVSHDLRTPLAAMKMMAESLYLGHVADAVKQKEFLRIIVRESERLHQLVERVLFFVRLGQDAMVYRFSEGNIGEVVEAAVDAFQARFAGASHPDIQLDVEPRLPIIRLDESAITQVMLNLLDNAWKYGPQHLSSNVFAGQATDNASTPLSASQRPTTNTEIEVTVRKASDRRGWLKTRRQGVVISVRDHGVGIEKEEQGKLFRKFYRVPGSQEANVSGVGLGLALCRHIVEAHGGRISVESRPGEGSTFWVFLAVTCPQSKVWTRRSLDKLG